MLMLLPYFRTLIRTILKCSNCYFYLDKKDHFIILKDPLAIFYICLMHSVVDELELYNGRNSNVNASK